jgi:uncharacterized protein YjbI with pentapeptide repeats
MTPVLRTTMAATLRASQKGLAIVDQARCKKGWTKTDQAWADISHTSQSTLRRFWAGISIQSAAFKYICQSVGTDDWESIVDDGAMAVSCIEEKPTSEKRKQLLVFELDVDFEGIDPQKLHAVIAQLSEMGNPVMRFVDVDEGSIKLLFEGSEEDYEQIETLFDSGELTELLGIPVKSIHVAESEELIQWIRKNGGSYLNLSSVNLIDASLRGANLSAANLSGAYLNGASLSGASLNGAYLSGAYLRGADLSNADLSLATLSDASLRGAYLSGANLSDAYLRGASLSGANLIGANLSGANLSGANLIGANLRGADLSKANLSGVYLNGANLSRANLNSANLSRANLNSANLSRVYLNGAALSRADVTKAQFGFGLGLSSEEKQDLIERGAIFDEGSRDRESSLSPAPSGRR